MLIILPEKKMSCIICFTFVFIQINHASCTFLYNYKPNRQYINFLQPTAFQLVIMSCRGTQRLVLDSQIFLLYKFFVIK